MKNIDPALGVPLPDKDYGGSCRIYDWENPADPFHNFKVRQTKRKSSNEILFDSISINRIKWIFLLCHISLVGG